MNPVSLAPVLTGAGFFAAAEELCVGRVADPVARAGPTGLVTGRLAGAAAPAAALGAVCFGAADFTAGFAVVPLREAVSFAGDFFSGMTVASAGCSSGVLCSSSTNLSGFLLGTSETAPVDEGSAIASVIGSVRATESSGEAIAFRVLWLEVVVSVVSLLKRRLEMLDSPL